MNCLECGEPLTLPEEIQNELCRSCFMSEHQKLLRKERLDYLFSAPIETDDDYKSLARIFSEEN